MSVHRKLALRLDAIKARHKRETTKPVESTASPSPARGNGFDDEPLIRTTTPPVVLDELEDERRRVRETMAARLGLSLEEFDALDEAFGGKVPEGQSGGDAGMTARYHAVFAQYDVDGSGAISPQELRELLKASGEDMDDDELSKVIAQADTDGDGEINFDEFIGLMRARKRLLLVAKTMGVTGQGPGSGSGSGSAGRNHKPTKSKSTASSPSTSSPLPPLKLASLPPKKQLHHFNRHFTRPTPSCLRPGAQVDLTTLRRELAIAEFGLQELHQKVREDVHWVQQNCPVTSLKAQIYCHRWGMEKVHQLLLRLQSQSLSRAYQKWKAFLMYERNKVKANLFLKCKGSQKMTEIMARWKRKTQRRRFNKWRLECQLDARHELQSAAIEIQRVARGRLARRWRRRLQEHEAARVMQALVRGHLGRQNARRRRQAQREHAAATLLQRCYRGYSGKRAAKALFKVQRETLAARRIQRAFRNHQRRVLLRAIQRAKLEHDSAVQLQCAMRSFLARRERRRRATRRREERGSLVLQRHARGFLARRQLDEKKRQRRASVQIQTRWRAYRSRWELYHLRTEKAQEQRRRVERRAAIQIQTRWRATHARQKYVSHRAQLREAERLLAFRRLTAALRIQCAFRGYRGRRHAQRLRYEKLKWMNWTVLNRSALKIQAFWRGYHGRLAAQLRLQAQRALEHEEQLAARRIQSIARGKLARGEVRRRLAKRDDAVRQQQIRTRCALQIQRVFRGKRARREAARLRQAHQDQARAALDRLILQTKTRAAIKIQCCGRRFLARLRYWRRKQAVERQRLEAERRRQHEHAAIVIQCAIRRSHARRLLRQRRRDFERRISLMASEKAYDEIERLRLEQEQELAKLRVQLMLQQQKADEEAAKMRRALEQQREDDEERREQEAQELAKLRLETLMAQHTQQSERKIAEHQRQQEAERLRERLERERQEKQQMEELVRTQENEELARVKMTALLQTTSIAKESKVDEEALRLEREAAQLRQAALAMQREQARLKIQNTCLKYIVRRRLQKLQEEQAAAIAKLQNEEERLRLRAIQEKELALAKLKAMMDEESRAREAEIKALETEMLERARQEKERIARRHAAARKIQAQVRGFIGRQRVRAIQRKIEKEREERARELEEQLAAAEAKVAEALSSTGGASATGEAAASTSTGGEQAVNPEDWVEYWDDNAQASYFYNVKTQEATWTRPYSAPSSKAMDIVRAATSSAGESDVDPYAEGYGGTGVNGYDGNAQTYADEYGYYDQYGQYHYYEEAQGSAYQSPYLATSANAAPMQAAMAAMYPGYAAAAAAYAYQAAMMFGAAPQMPFGAQMAANSMMMSMGMAGGVPATDGVSTMATTSAAPAEGDGTAPPDPWEKFFDQYSGAAYYYNNITGERYWA
ncbi:hypothetical protein P43SY_008655 [Pythium insidiosum]|uniref:Calmodulin n=1 Tax=Pythium insidiosum TaxID=114742 RepID=A0AAD5LHY4_PYTIN|nr:hypothetical protein P43SY_008655 [Pythium insidiosum]